MPKASQHHCHLGCHPSGDWFVKKTYESDVYVHEPSISVKVYKKGNAPECWLNIQQMRQKSQSISEFDAKMADYFALTEEERLPGKGWTNFAKKDWQ